MYKKNFINQWYILNSTTSEIQLNCRSTSIDSTMFELVEEKVEVANLISRESTLEIRFTSNQILRNYKYHFEEKK